MCIRDSHADQPARQQEHAIACQRPTEQYDHVVRRDQAKSELHRHRRQPVEGVQRMKVEADAGGVVKNVSEERIHLTRYQRIFEPPEIPVVLPAVETVAGNGGGEVQRQRPGEDGRGEQVAEERQ